MKSGIAGRTAIVTGASRGIGRAIAFALAAEGANVVICARGGADLAAAATDLQALGEAIAIQADVTHPEAASLVVGSTVERFGRVDILINNAVTSSQNTFAALSDEDWRMHLDVKLLGYVRFCRAAVPRMAENGWGRVVNLGGMSARIVTDFRMTNGAVNAAVANFSKHLAEEAGPKGITVNTIHPGYTWTPRLEAGLKRWAELEKRSVEDVTREREAEIPIGRFVRPEDVANVATFLCSDLAQAVTGQSIAVDGGSGRAIAY